MDLTNTPHIIHQDRVYFPNEGLVTSNTNSFWAKVFDFHYGKILDRDNATADTSVWKSSYNGTPFSKDEMDDWILNAITKIKQLDLKGKSVLEIGCGNGLVFSSIINDIEKYTGTDIAESALASISNSSLGQTNKEKISLYHSPANMIDKIEGSYDLIIINSVAQYFPDLNYLFDFFDKCESKLVLNGSIFIGDLRSFDLADDFYRDIAFSKFPDNKEEAERFYLKAKNNESETLYSPSLFKNLPAVFPWLKSAEVTKKISNFNNEMSRFRFDAIFQTAVDESRSFSFSPIEQLSNRISTNLDETEIAGKTYAAISLHPKLFKLAELYERNAE